MAVCPYCDHNPSTAIAACVSVLTRAEAAESSLAAAQADIKNVTADRDFLLKSRRYFADKLMIAEATVATLSSRVAELEAGLKPFADEANSPGNERLALGPDIDHWPIGSNALTLGDLRHARDLLQKDNPND